MAIIQPIPLDAKYERRFVCYFWFVRWDCISLGLHVSFAQPNIEIHLPFGFVRIGWSHGHFPARWQAGRATGLAD